MARRIVWALALVVPLLAVGVTAQPALADEASTADNVVNTLLYNDWNGSLFNGYQSCPTTNTGNSPINYGQCWWWAAVTWDALITYAENNPNSPNTPVIKSDLWSTYTTICNDYRDYWGPCPTTDNQTGKDPFTINQAGNTYFDDIGWWTQTWIDAYQLVGRPYYKYLAEELWNYVTNNGYKDSQFVIPPNSTPTPTNCNNGSGSGAGIVQYHKATGDVGAPDLFANALYLRNSAKLFQITKNEGASFSGQYISGAINVASWIRQHLLDVYSGTVGTDATFMMWDHVGPNSAGDPLWNAQKRCQAVGNQWQLHGQGEMVQAWADMASACSIPGAGCAAGPSYYNTLADELADSIATDQPGSKPPQFQAEPAVDTHGVLSEPCIPDPGNSWPNNCEVGSGIDTYPAWLISKGVFEHAIYCLDHNLNGSDQTLRDFSHTNGSNILGANYGFLWDPSQYANANTVVVYATRTSVLDGLEADVEVPGLRQTNSYDTC